MSTSNLPTPQNFGAKGDGVTDDTAALQKWITNIQSDGISDYGKGGFLPPGTYLTGPLIMRRTISIFGSGPQNSILVLKTGSQGPLLTFQNSYSTTYKFPGTVLEISSWENFKLTGNKNDPNGIANGCDGILFRTPANNKGWPQVNLSNVDITLMPRDGIRSFGMQGAVACTNCKIDTCGQQNLNVNSCTDWQFTQCLFGSAGQYNALLSGCTQFIFTTCNFFTPKVNNLYMYSAADSGTNRFVSCSFDRAQQHGIVYDNYSGHNLFSGCYWNNNSLVGKGLYSDIFVTNRIVQGPVLSGCYFAQTTTEKYNIEFEAIGPSVYVTGGTQFKNGGISSPNVTNSVGQIVVTNVL